MSVQGDDSHPRGPLSSTHDPLTAIAMAEGILIERYRLSATLANALLTYRAAAAGLTVVDTARWLVATNALP